MESTFEDFITEMLSLILSFRALPFFFRGSRVPWTGFAYLQVSFVCSQLCKELCRFLPRADHWLFKTATAKRALLSAAMQSESSLCFLSLRTRSRLAMNRGRPRSTQEEAKASCGLRVNISAAEAKKDKLRETLIRLSVDESAPSFSVLGLEGDKPVSKVLISLVSAIIQEEVTLYSDVILDVEVSEPLTATQADLFRMYAHAYFTLFFHFYYPATSLNFVNRNDALLLFFLRKLSFFFQTCLTVQDNMVVCPPTCQESLYPALQVVRFTTQVVASILKSCANWY